MKLLLVIVMLGVLLPGEVAALSCYQCMSGAPNSAFCLDPIDVTAHSATNCTDTAAKYCVKSKYVQNGVTTLNRTCAVDCEDDTVISSGDLSYIRRCCTQDACNTALMTSFSVSLIVTSLIVAIPCLCMHRTFQ